MYTRPRCYGIIFGWFKSVFVEILTLEVCFYVKFQKGYILTRNITMTQSCSESKHYVICMYACPWCYGIIFGWFDSTFVEIFTLEVCFYVKFQKSYILTRNITMTQSCSKSKHDIIWMYVCLWCSGVRPVWSEAISVEIFTFEACLLRKFRRNTGW